MADAEEDEVYGGELPEEVEGELDADGAEGAGDEDADLDAMKARLKEMEEEAAKLSEMQAKMEQEMSGAPAGDAAAAADREEVDSRSVFIGSVDYQTTPEELQVHFQSCGTVNHVTILTDKQGNPKGFAYLEFLEAEAVQNALLLTDTELHGRKITVKPKRTNVPGMKQGGKGRGRGGKGGKGGWGMPFFDPYGFMAMAAYGWGGKGGRGGKGRGRGGKGGGRGQPY